MRTTITVSDEQIESARALIDVAGGADHVDPLIARIAAAKPRSRPGSGDASAAAGKTA